ncbi:helix-turn-helix domain-containing protein [bacterium]|nr:helix-turn-helix domain-containing protein [bacterium]
MALDPTACYRALRARDRRFDGRFFVGVRTTGVYCRPICPAPTPLRANIELYACAAAAEAAGFRPCKRCRPETSPGTPAWLGSSAAVSRALRLIRDGALDGGGVAALAARLGVGERQLRRLFDQHLGASPAAVARAQRLQAARAMIDQTSLPMIDIATAAGFQSVRQFNHAVRQRFGAAPRALRQQSVAWAASLRERAGLALRVPYRPPLDWPGLLAFLAARATPGVESVAGDVYRRSVRIGETVGWLEVAPVAGASALVVRLWPGDGAALLPVVERVRRLFDLGADPLSINAHLRADPRLRPLVAARPGLRVPGAWDPFEIAVRGIVGQQISVAGATTLIGRLVARCGARVDLAADLTHLFPTPAALAAADLAGIGMPGARAAALQGLARAVADGRLRLDAARGLEEAVARLRALPGVGEWTAQYIAMRGLGEPDACPHGDLVLRQALGGVSAAALARAADAWRPWRAYAAVHLWAASAQRNQRATQRRSA